jgi:hypothetical protein
VRAFADHWFMSRKQASRRVTSTTAWAQAALVSLLLAALSLGPATAQANKAPVAATPSSAPVYVDLASSRGGFDCSPGPIGAGTLPTTRHNDAGSVAWWYCPTVGGGWRVNWAVATAAQMSVGNMFSEARAILSASDPKAAFSAAVSKNVKVPLSDPSLTVVWQPFVAEMIAGMPATPDRSAASASPATR